MRVHNWVYGGFLSHRATPFHHPNLSRIFHEINQPFWILSLSHLWTPQTHCDNFPNSSPSIPVMSGRAGWSCWRYPACHAENQKNVYRGRSNLKATIWAFDQKCRYLMMFFFQHVFHNKKHPKIHSGPGAIFGARAEPISNRRVNAHPVTRSTARLEV